MSWDPLDEYSRRHAEAVARSKQLDRLDATLAQTRLALFVAGVACAAGSFGMGWFTPWLLTVPVALFVALVIWHASVFVALARSQRRVAYYHTALQRLSHVTETVDVHESWAPADHPYAADLDLFGADSLFSLLCTARSQVGRATLAQWLLNPATPDTINNRHAAVSELRPRVALREELAILGDALRTALNPQGLLHWGAAPRRMPPAAARAILLFCNVGFTVWMVLWGAGRVNILPVLGWVSLQWVVARVLRDRVDAVMAALQEPARELPLCAAVMQRFEQEALSTPTLLTLVQNLTHGGVTASSAIQRLSRLSDLYDSAKNQLLAPFAWLLLWNPHIAFGTESWRHAYGPHLRAWLKALGELEALTSISGYAYEHPHDPFPVIDDTAPLYKAQGLGHPLLHDAACVRNDVHLGASLRLLMISGSNMSGKSTMMRTVGINAVLALAGAPVRAHALTLSRFNLGATLRIQDSIQLGSSRFHAEITRLRRLLDLTEQPLPLLFLLDEILHGTNSHDRTIGAAAVMGALLKRGACGIVTTHDLSLTAIVADLGIPARNVHFADSLVQDKLHFDYTMRDGVVTQSNALALMRAVGLMV